MMNIDTMPTEAQAKVIGEQLVAMLSLTKNEDGKYNTSWGSKTLIGIGRCVQRIVEEAVTPKE